jgi:hypothetical protein
MQNIDQQIMQLYSAFMNLMMFLSLVILSIGTFVIFLNGRSSTDRTQIGIGTALQAISVVVLLGVVVLQQVSPQFAPGQSVFLFYGISHFLGVVGTALGLWGAVKLLKRAAQMELLLEDRDDDR